jgi:zinc transporter 2
MLSDVAGFLISYFAIYMGSRPANYQMSFGYHRAEILGALASIMLIWGIIIYLFIEAIHRIIDPEEIDGEIMLITAVVGLVCNIISIFTLHSCGGGHHHHGHDHGGHEHGEKEPAGVGEEGRKLSHCHQPALQGSKKHKDKKITDVIHHHSEKVGAEKDANTNETGAANVVVFYEDNERTSTMKVAKPVNYSEVLSDNSQLFSDRKYVVPLSSQENPYGTPNSCSEKHDHDKGSCSHNHEHKHEEHGHDHHEHGGHGHNHGGHGHSHAGHDH